MRQHPTRLSSLIAALVIVAAIAGACAPVATPTPAPPAPTDVSEITDIVWQWTNVGGPATELQITDPENYTVTFLPQNQLSVQADCNMVSGIYAVAGDRLTIQLGPSTRAFCGEESLDQTFLGLLAQVNSFALDGGALALTTAGSDVLTFANGGAPQPEAEAPETDEPSAFIGVPWEWEAFRSPEESMSYDVAEPQNYTALFAAAGSLALRADCNRALGEYTLDGESLAITLGPTTLAECAPGSLYSDYLRMLGDVATWVMDGDKLVLNLKLDSGDLVFRRIQSLSGTEIAPDQVSLDTQGLPYSWQANSVAETPYDASMPPGPMGMPAHLQVNFSVTDPALVQPSDPIMYILPVNAYRLQWEAAGNGSVTQTIDAIYGYTVALQEPPPTNGMPALPSEQAIGFNDVAAQIARVTGISTDSAARDGYRFIGRWAQDANPVTNGQLRYVYQGFTNDGKQLVSFWYPVSSPALPDSVADLPESEMALFNADPQAYITAQVEMLNALPPSGFEPNLDTLDALVASLRITDMPADGLTGYVWWPAAQADEPGGEWESIANTGNLSVSYYPSGTLSYVADCNSGTGTYTLDGAVTGSIRTTMGASTMAACGRDSWGDTLVNTLTAAQDFRVLPGGNRMWLYMPAGGPVVAFVKAGPAEETLPEPPPTVVVPTPAPTGATGTITADPGVNVRSGPGTNYPIVGFAPLGATGQIIGRSADGEWWVTPLPSVPGGLGWVSTAWVQATGAENVPVIPAPAPPAPNVTPTPLPQPTATPTGSPEISFWADRTQINQGECVTLNWRAVNVAAVWVYPQGQPYQNYPVPGEGSRVECPRTTTTYEMRVQLRDGGIVIQRVTIQVAAVVTATPGPTATPVPPTPVPPTAVPPTAVPPTPVPPTATPAPPSNPLVNTSWVVTRFEGFGVPIGQPPTLAFMADSRVDVFGGCNNYSSTYTVNGNQIAIVIGPGGMMACEEDVMTQEQYYLDLLRRSTMFELPGSDLVLRDGSGMELLRFARR